MSQPLPARPVVSSAHRLLKLQRLRRLSRLLDNAIAIPGTGYRVGLDPILGLIPGGGDVVGLAFSTYIIIEAARLGIPKKHLMQMVSNVVFETVVGTVPVLGDLFDFAWKANVRNIALLESQIEVPAAQRTRNRWFMVGLIAGSLVAMVGLVALSVLVVRGLIQLWG